MDRTKPYAGWFGVLMIGSGLLICLGGVINLIGLIARGDDNVLLLGAVVFVIVGGTGGTIASIVFRRRQRRRSDS